MGTGSGKQQTIGQVLAAATAKANQRASGKLTASETEYENLVDTVQRNLSRVRQLEVDSAATGSQIEQVVHKAFAPPQPKWAEVFTQIDTLYKKRAQVAQEKIGLVEKCKTTLASSTVKVRAELNKLKADLVKAEKDLAAAQEKHAKQREKQLQKQQKRKEKQGAGGGAPDKKKQKNEGNAGSTPKGSNNGANVFTPEMQQNKGKGGFDNLYKTIRVKWEEDGVTSWFSGTVIGYEPVTNKHVIFYPESNEEEYLELGVDIKKDEYYFVEAATPQK